MRGETTEETVRRTVAFVRTMCRHVMPPLRLSDCLVERQPPRAIGDNVAVSHALVAAVAMCAPDVRVRYRHALRHGERQYAKRKVASARLFRARVDEDSCIPLQRIPARQRIHIYDAYHLARMHHDTNTVRLAV